MEKKLESIVVKIVNDYFICKNEFTVTNFASGHQDYSNPFYIFYRDVEIALSLLNKEERLIIQNEFFTHSDSSWWTHFFSRNSFNKKRENAIEHFVRCFHEIH